MELVYAVVLLIVGSVTAGPHGYGTKGGAAVKADARAVAGAYTGAGSLPLSIPSGASYSGSFSKSSSSSSSSSSASSSSFSYSGSGAFGAVHPGGSACGSGNCNVGGATGSQGSVAAGSQAYSGANAGSLSGGFAGKSPSDSYSHKYNDGAQDNKRQDCGSGDCQKTSDLSSSNMNGAIIGLQASSDTKAAASAKADHTTGSECDGSFCRNIPNGGSNCVSGQCGSKLKCSSGDCDTTSHIGGTPTQYDSNNCASGQCGPYQDTQGSSSGDNSEANDINVHASGTANSKSSYSANKPGCSGENCESSPLPGLPVPSGFSKPSLDLLAPKLESSCSGYNCPISPGSSSSSQTKAPYISTNYQSENQMGHMSSASGYNGLSKSTYSNGASSSYSPSTPSGSAGCAPGNPGCGVNVDFSSSSDCSSGSCDAKPSAPGLSSGNPSYFHGTTTVVNPSSSTCPLGTPGCIPSNRPNNPTYCASGNCGTQHSVQSGLKPHESSHSFSTFNPSGLDCTPGTPGCSTAKPPSGPLNYGSSLSIKPIYSHETGPSYASGNPSSLGCTPGSPGCSVPISPSGSLSCTSGNCGGSTSSTGFVNVNKPNYSQGSLTSYSALKPVGPGCAPGSPNCGASLISTGCVSGDCSVSPTAHDVSSNIKPNYSHGSSSSYRPTKPMVPCMPGIPGCSVASSTSQVYDCPSGNCGSSYSSAPGYNGSPSIKPGYTHESLPSLEAVKPLTPCTPGTPGCNASPSVSGSSDCLSGNCGSYPSLPGYSGASTVKPNYSQSGYPSFSSSIPSGPVCAPGSPGCILSPGTNGPSDCKSGNCGVYPTTSGGDSLGIKPSYYGSLPAVSSVGQDCVPGSPGCAVSLASSGLSRCTSGNCVQGGVPIVKPSNSGGSSSYFPIKPLVPGCAPGTPGCSVTPSLSSSSECASGNCGTNSSPQGCAPGTLGCPGSTSTINKGSGTGPTVLVPGTSSYGISSLPSGQTSTGISDYGVSGIGSTSPQTAYGIHGTGSLQTTFTKPLTGPATGISANGAYMPAFPAASGSTTGIIGSLPEPSIVGATAETNGQKENLPSYTGGFGGPAGILKHNEYSAAPISSIGKPTVSTLTTLKPSKCVSGNCDTQNPHSGSVSGAQATAEAVASANAVAYTGGFGGPPGLLKPYDNGKADIKADTGIVSSSGLHQGISGSGHLSDGSHVTGSAAAQAAAASTAGAGSGYNFYSGNHGGYSHGHEHGGAGGCDGACGGISGGLGYSRSFGLSKTGTLDDPNNGLAGASAVAKSVANASSGAKSFGNSYATSSASAHAGASVKGGYGKR